MRRGGRRETSDSGQEERNEAGDNERSQRVSDREGRCKRDETCLPYSVASAMFKRTPRWPSQMPLRRAARLTLARHAPAVALSRLQQRRIGENALKKSAVEISISTAPETASKPPENCAFRPFDILKTVKLKWAPPKTGFLPPTRQSVVGKGFVGRFSAF